MHDSIESNHGELEQGMGLESAENADVDGMGEDDK